MKASKHDGTNSCAQSARRCGFHSGFCILTSVFAFSFLLTIAFCGAALAQNEPLMRGHATWHGVDLSFETILYPPMPPFAGGFTGGSLTDESAIHRHFFYNSQQKYFGYDVLAEPVPKTDFYKLTFRPLTVVDPKRLEIDHPETWSQVPLLGYPVPQMVKVGDTVELVLFKNPATGQGIIEHVRVLGQKGRENPYVLGTGDSLFVNVVYQPDASGGFVVRPDGTLPLGRFGEVKAVGLTVDQLTAALEDRLSLYFNHPKVNVRIMSINGKNAPGVARDLSVNDVELRVIAPQVFLNGKHVYLATYEDGVVGPIVWFYLPDHGRYILSLVQRPSLAFVKAGEVRGSTLTFTIDGETLSLTSGVDIAPGYAPYNLYVSHEATWRPKEEALAGTFLLYSAQHADSVLQAAKPKPYEIAPKDMLYVNVLHNPDVSGGATVKPDGFVTVRFAGEVKAAGMTTQQLSIAIAELLTKHFFYRPEVNVQVVRLNEKDKKFYVSGKIEKPGIYILTTTKTVLEAITEAGGPASSAKTREIYVLRGPQKLSFNYSDVSKGKHPEQNILLRDGDVINVP
jgi:polysaccharide export outer membrane protein